MMIKCPECGKEISDKAAACPNCGCPASVFPTAAATPEITGDASGEGEKERRELEFVSENDNYLNVRCSRCGKIVHVPKFLLRDEENQSECSMLKAVTCENCGIVIPVGRRAFAQTKERSEFVVVSEDDKFLNMQCTRCQKIIHIPKEILQYEAEQGGYSLSTTVGCDNCGTSIPAGETVYVPTKALPQETESNFVSAEISQKKTRQRRVYIGVAIGLIIALFLFIFTRPTKQEKIEKEIVTLCGRYGLAGVSCTVNSAIPQYEFERYYDLYDVTISCDGFSSLKADDSFQFCRALDSVGESTILKSAEIISDGHVYTYDLTILENERSVIYQDGEELYTRSGNGGSSADPAPSYTAPGEDDISSALFVLAKKAVTNHLMVPSTAEFCEWNECLYSKMEDNVYSMSGHVDAENIYGAKRRCTWTILAELDGEKLTMIMVLIDDDAYFD